MATDARAYYDIDTQGFDPNTEQTRAFNQATQTMSPAERQQLSDFFAGQARASGVPTRSEISNMNPSGGGGKAPAQKARVQQGEQAMAAVGNWLRTPEAQNFLGGGGYEGQNKGPAPTPPQQNQLDPGQKGGQPRRFIPPQDADSFMGENQRDQQMMQQQSQREALINYLMGMQQQNQYRPPMRRPQMMPNQMPYDPGFGVVGGSRVNPNPIGQQGPRPQPRFNAFQVPQNRGMYGGY